MVFLHYNIRISSCKQALSSWVCFVNFLTLPILSAILLFSGARALTKVRSECPEADRQPHQSLCRPAQVHQPHVASYI